MGAQTAVGRRERAPVNVAMTVVARDQADAIESHLDFHLAAGVDVVLVLDGGSSDDTRAILERYARHGSIHVLPPSAGELDEPEEAARMAHLAATEHGADWVIHSEASEFWWPLGGSLREVLESVPGRYGIVQSLSRHFVPVLGEGSFAETMIYRLSPQAPIGDPTSPWAPCRRFVRRAAAGRELRPLRGWYPIETLRFPVGPGTGDAYGPEAVGRALADGLLSVDTRLRDALRLLAEGREALTFPRPDAVEAAQLALDVAVLGEADVLRTHGRLDALEARLAAVESTLPAALMRKLRTAARAARPRGGPL